MDRHGALKVRVLRLIGKPRMALVSTLTTLIQLIFTDDSTLDLNILSVDIS
jgi:hypothetical protein